MGNFSRIFCIILVAVFLLFAGTIQSMASGEGWITKGDGIAGNIQYIYSISGTDTVFLGTDKGLYASIDSGAVWEPVDLPGGSVDVRMIDGTGEKLVLAVSGGLYIGTREGSEFFWKKVEGKSDVMGAMPFKDGNVLAWTKGALYEYGKGDWKTIGKGGSWDTIDDVRVFNDSIYLLSEGSLFFLEEGESSWKKRGLSSFASENEIEIDVLMEDRGEGFRDKCGRFDRYSFDRLYVVTKSGIVGMEKNLQVEKIGTTGLPSGHVEFAAFCGTDLVSATDKTVYLYNRATGGWDTIFKEPSFGGISALAVQKDRLNETWVWVAGKRRVYKERIFGGRYDLGMGSTNGKRVFAEGPSIREVQTMAIEYAEVSPKKINGWRTGARWKALLPKLSIGFSESVDDNVEIYKSASRYYIVDGPSEKGSDWDIDLSWDISDLIWNESQTSIDVRSKLMVQLREDILEEVTRLYFERKKLIREVSIGNASMEKTFRVEELTAYIDAYTGGEFSRRMEPTEI